MYHQDICPYCHGQNFVLARQRPDGRLVYSEIVTLEPGSLYHILCLNCGTVVRTFMDDPSVLLTLDPEPEETRPAGTQPAADALAEPGQAADPDRPVTQDLHKATGGQAQATPHPAGSGQPADPQAGGGAHGI